MASSSHSPFDDLCISLDPTTIHLALGQKRVKAIDHDGTIIYQDEYAPPLLDAWGMPGLGLADKENSESLEADLTSQLERIWNEYPSGLLDLSESKLASLPPDADAIAFQPRPRPEEGEGGEGEGEKKRDVFKMMDWDEMERLRSEMFMQLNDARNELWFALELAKTLAVSSSHQSQPPPPPPTTLHQNQPQKKHPKPKPTPNPPPAPPPPPTPVPGEPPILPPGTFTTTPSSLPSLPLHTTVNDLIQLVRARDGAVEECLGLVDGAVEELELMGRAGERFWRDVRGLREGLGGGGGGGGRGRGRWAVVPKPDFARTMKAGEKAQDVIIPYAIDEASPATRARCLAAFDLDPTLPTSLSFPARGGRRVRVLVRDLAGGVVSSGVEGEGEGKGEGEGGDGGDGDGGVGEEMERAQMEAFDEDLFTQIRIEASTLDKSIIEPTQIQIPIPTSNHTLIFQLYSPPSAPSPSPSTSPPHSSPHANRAPTSPLCKLLLASARMNLLSGLRVHKQELVAPSSSSSLHTPSSSGVVGSLLEGLQFKSLWEGVQSTVRSLADALSGAGVEAEVGWDVSVGKGGKDTGDQGIRSFLGQVLQGNKNQLGEGEGSGEGGGGGFEVVWSLSLADSGAIKISLSPPTLLLITLPSHNSNSSPSPSSSTTATATPTANPNPNPSGPSPRPPPPPPPSDQNPNARGTRGTSSFRSTNPGELSYILAGELERQLLGLIEGRLKTRCLSESGKMEGEGEGKKKGKGKGKGKKGEGDEVWWDKLVGVVQVGRRRLKRKAGGGREGEKADERLYRVSLPPPYHTIYASISSPPPTRPSSPPAPPSPTARAVVEDGVGQDEGVMEIEGKQEKEEEDIEEEREKQEEEKKEEKKEGEEKYDSRDSEGGLWDWVDGLEL
ncbi:hypothetical protein B9479_005675 [Cryptococcus floricola]|uniref:Mediator of RNA polymerase II transcription subunit 17 n=1 Tax=Cryptococcus floricola TaxID=2591691 RepID=A0A5D3ASL7_9TREE|nr:hypothetical protein B9479_005675 [Cryptococcus floricola]